MAKAKGKGSQGTTRESGRAEVIGQGRFLRLVRRGKWEFVERIRSSGVVGIIATTPGSQLVLVEQWREAAGAMCIELPAGLVGDEQEDEDAVESARRELEEETGYRAAWLEHVADGLSSAGLTDELVGLYRAGGLERVHEGGGTASEDIRVHTVPLAEVPAFLRHCVQDGRKVDVKVWAALWFIGR